MQGTAKQHGTLGQRLMDYVERLRSEVLGTPSGSRVRRLVLLGKDAEKARQIEAWLSSPGLQAPR